MANGNVVIDTVKEQGVEVILYENARRGTQFKAYQLGLVEFVRGDDIPRRDRSTGQFERNEDGSLSCGVSRNVSATTAMGGNLIHAVTNLRGGSFQRSVDFLKSALLPRTGKSMVEFKFEDDTLSMACDIRLTILGKVEEIVVTSELPATRENLAEMRLLAAEEIAAQIVARVGNTMAEYVDSLEPDDTVENEVAAKLESIKFK